MDTERLRTVLGPRKDRYLAKFARIEHVRGWVPGWNTAAFLHSTAWFWYRRMYGWSLLNLFAPLLLLALLVFGVQWIVPERYMNATGAVLGFLYAIFVFGAVPVYADTFYYRHLKRRRWRGKPPSPWTLTGAILLVLVPLTFAYFVAQAQRDYNDRERMGEGIERAVAIKGLIDDFYRQEKHLPGALEAATFRERVPMRFTESVAWDAQKQVIVIVMRAPLEGRRFEVRPQEKDGRLEWTCRSFGLDDRPVPPYCRP